MRRPRDTCGVRGRVKGETLFHVHVAGRHGHVRIIDVALSLPYPIRLFRNQHPLAVVKMRAVRTGGYVPVP